LCAAASTFSASVFINCPFDRAYVPLFEAIVFCVIDSGFIPRCALEEPDAGEPRVHRIRRLIAGSQYSIHDLSRIELTQDLPRFNMPFELGLDLGARVFGNRAMSRKRFLILDSKRYRYQQVLSDIAGQDIRAHENAPDEVITHVRNWLRGVSHRTSIRGPSRIKERFARFSGALPSLCNESGLDRSDVQFTDYITVIEEWSRAAR